jgi:hypothetical protein
MRLALGRSAPYLHYRRANKHKRRSRRLKNNVERGLIERAREALKSALRLGASKPRHSSFPKSEARLDECMDGAERDESFVFADVTDHTLEDMRQENAHSLERDPSDHFFWSQARPDAVAGMAKVYLCARCPTPYWRALVSANAYGLWGAVALARILASSSCEECLPKHLGHACFVGVASQARILESRVLGSQQFLLDLMRADGLPLPMTPLGDVHKHAALRALFAAVLLDKPIDWPDLPARLGGGDDIPSSLPCLWVDLSDLSARASEIERAEAESFWLSSFHDQSHHLLMVPDWASWMLSEGHHKPFAKTPALHQN